MLVDRIYTVVDEYGPRIAFLRLGWTVAAAVVCLGIMLQAHWGEWLLMFPESHAVTAAAIIMLGRYRGRRLADLSWLGWMKEPSVNIHDQQQGSVQNGGGKQSSED